MWYIWEKGQFCNSLDPCAIEDSLCRAPPVPLWQSQCGVHLTPSLGGMTLTWCCLRSSLYQPPCSLTWSFRKENWREDGVGLRNQQLRKLSGLG